MAQQFQRLRTAIQYADAFRAIQLVAGEYIKITAQLLHIVAAMHHALSAIDHSQRPLGAGMGE
ncbi:hypothetical protein D3C75_1304530 [compost metagenome]